MQPNRRRIVFVKLTVVAVAAFLAIFGFLSFSAKFERPAQASASGPSASHTNAPNEDNCTTCHTSFPLNSGTGGISVSGLPVNYLPNQQIPVTVTVNQTDAVIYGFQLTAIDGQGRRVGSYTIPPSSQSQIQTITGVAGGNQRLYIEHTVDGVIPTVFGTKSWSFVWNAPAQRVGKVNFYVAGNAANSDGTTSGDYIYATAKSTRSGTGISDFDGDGKTDVAVFRPSNGTWYYLRSGGGAGFAAIQFGLSGDKPAAGDYDGDGRADIAVWRPSDGVWYVLKSSDSTFTGVQWGISSDTPVVGDYDGDGRSDYAVYRPSNGVWYLLQSTAGVAGFQFGIPTDKPTQADFDADGRTDIAVYRPETGVWYILKSRDGFSALQFGISTDKPVQADYDGDGRADVAVYRPETGVWYILRNSGGFTGYQWGIATDKPVPGDYDGDGLADLAVYRPAEGRWYILRSSDNSFSVASFGLPEDLPAPGGFIAE